MPVTAKLSRKFYEKLGDDVATELVDWFNMVDSTYRSELKELNELNFARFDAKLEQRAAALEAKLEQRVTELRAEMQAGFARLDAKLEQRIGEVRSEFRAEMREGFARVDQRFAEFETRLTKRLFGFWVAQAGATAGLVFAVVKLVGG